MDPTMRYCGKCDKVTIYNYDRRIGHSVCTECGWRFIPTLSKEDLAKFKKMCEKAWVEYDKWKKKHQYAKIYIEKRYAGGE